MKSSSSPIEQLILNHKKELNNPLLNIVKKTYLTEKIKMFEEFLLNNRFNKNWFVTLNKPVLLSYFFSALVDLPGQRTLKILYLGEGMVSPSR